MRHTIRYSFRAKLQVQKNLYTGIEVRFGEQKYEPKDDLGPAVIQLIGDGINVDAGSSGDSTPETPRE